jgi:predicted SAM-dependent methyltransferase
VRRLRRRIRDRRLIDRYVQANNVRKLQIGTGSNPLPGWLNTDLLPDTYPEYRDRILFLDATKPFPLDDMSFDYVFSEHQIEHLSVAEAIVMFEECFRVLRPSGRLRLATPDLAVMVGLYADPISDVAQDYVRWVMETFWPEAKSGNERCYVINHIFMFHRHRFIYDYETLSALLTDVGFVDIARWEAGESHDLALRGLEAHGTIMGDALNRFETLVIEAVRPE